MKALLICPGPRQALPALSTTMPLSNVPILGKPLLEHWLEHLVTQGTREVIILSADRADQVGFFVGTGARWGLKTTVRPEPVELSPDEARQRYPADAEQLASPGDAILMDHLPGLPAVPLLSSYADWFAAIQSWLPRGATRNRVGVRALKPGVWVGLHAHIAADVQLHAPCWVGENAYIDRGAQLGPFCVIENDVFVGRGAAVSQSIVGPETLVGEQIEVRCSLAWGSTLINWERDSCVTIPDEILLCSLSRQKAAARPARLASKLAGLAAQFSSARVVEQFEHLLETAFLEIRRPD